MDRKPSSQSPAREPREVERRAYAKPGLRRLGGLKALTLGGGFTFSDGVNTTMMASGGP